MTFAQRLRQLREAAGLSEAKLAQASGVSFGAVHNYGLGLRMPTFAAVVRLARALETTCEAFADCEDLMEADGRGKPAAKPTPKRSSRKERKKG
jgi:transcriptional regulator with XRE-family HTH domain